MPSSSSASDPLLTDHEWEQLGRFVAGELEGASAEMWRRRIATDATLGALVDRLRRPVPPAAVDVEGALATVHARMAEPSALPSPVPASGSRWRSCSPATARVRW
jgi:hypothetical protein